MNHIVFNPIIPVPFVIALGAGLLLATIYVYLRVAARTGWWRNILLLALRLAGVSIVLTLLLQPSRREEMPQRHIQRVLLVGLDSSRSMGQKDVDKISRLEAAKNAISDAGLVSPDNTQLSTRFFQFGEDASPLAPDLIGGLKADGATTAINRSVETMVNSLSVNESPMGLVLLTDGHDFEGTNFFKTAAYARARRVPIYAVPLGGHGLVRDASVNLTNYEPNSFVNQKVHIAGAVRLIGCEHEIITVVLLKDSKVIKSLRLNTGEETELPVDFMVSEPQVGQYEYEIRALPLNGESDVKNNSALTFLNVTDQRIRVLMLEGSPYWDTTFLRRSLFQNDKVEMEALVQYTKDKVRRIRKSDITKDTPDIGEAKDLDIPSTQQEFDRYDVIILGKSVEHLLNAGQMALLDSFVKEHGGTVIFSRGEAFDRLPDAGYDLDPVIWADKGSDHVRFEVAREGLMLSPFRLLSELPGGVDSLPELIAARDISDRKTLSAILGQVRDADTSAELPGIIHRRVGRGQVLSVAVDGLWKWSFNPKASATNNAFDRFWDQLLIWLVAGGDTASGQQFTFRANTANVLLGSAVHFRLASSDPKLAVKEAPVTIYYGDSKVANTTLTPRVPEDLMHLTGDYVPEKAGRYRAVVTLPNGKEQETKWIAFEENLEEKEVAADVAYLKNLCEASGGKLLEPEELAALAKKSQNVESDVQPKVRYASLWDRPWVFYAICVAFGLDWYLRRKWGLC